MVKWKPGRTMRRRAEFLKLYVKCPESSAEVDWHQTWTTPGRCSFSLSAVSVLLTQMHSFQRCELEGSKLAQKRKNEQNDGWCQKEPWKQRRSCYCNCVIPRILRQAMLTLLGWSNHAGFRLTGSDAQWRNYSRWRRLRKEWNMQVLSSWVVSSPQKCDVQLQRRIGRKCNTKDKMCWVVCKLFTGTKELHSARTLCFIRSAKKNSHEPNITIKQNNSKNSTKLLLYNCNHVDI